MANLNTVEEVAPLVPDLAPASLTPFINSANLVVVEQLSGKGLSDARLKLIEAYLAGHYATVSNGEKTMQKLGDSTESYAKATSGAGFLETALGRQAVTFDTTGTLSEMGKVSGSFDMLT
jgi:hypothetical protein